MKKESQIIIRKRLLITNDRLNELQSLLTKYCTKIDWEATISDGTIITFDSFKELQQYSNFGSTKILEIKTVGRSDDSKTIIRVTISRKDPSVKHYGKCSFEFEKEDQYTVFRKEIQDFFDKCIEGEIAYQVGRWLLTVIILGVILYTILRYTEITETNIALLVMCYFVLGGIAFLISSSVSTKILGFAFPSIVFAIGEGVTRYEKLKKLRSNIFWGVIIAVIIGLAVSLVMQFLHH